MEDMICTAKESLTSATKHFLSTFSFVPDDKLTWSPSETARTPLLIAAHISLATTGICSAIKGETQPITDKAEFFAMVKAMEAGINTREMAIEKIEESTASALATLDSLPVERLSAIAETPFGNMPVAMLVSILGPHIFSHAAQVDYIQTIWGDLQDHM